MGTRVEREAPWQPKSGWNSAGRGDGHVPPLISLPSAALQLNHQDSVEGLVLINIDPNAKGWMDWAAHKVWRGLCAEI